MTAPKLDENTDRPRVLVAEDDSEMRARSTRALMSVALRRSKLPVTSFVDGAHGWARALGARGVLDKPVDLDRFRTLVDALIRGSLDPVLEADRPHP